MAKTFFTSDLHLGHRLMLDHEKHPSQFRSYPTMEEHDQGIINIINGQAPSWEDTIYIIGDMSFHKPLVTANILDCIRARKVLVKGNHDHRKKNAMGALLPDHVMIRLGEFHQYLERTFTVNPEGPGQLIVMFHFPIMHWHKQHFGSWHLHGHLHGNPSGIPGKALDVGWDKWGRMLELQELQGIMDALPSRGNHHTEEL